MSKKGNRAEQPKAPDHVSRRPRFKGSVKRMVEARSRDFLNRVRDLGDQAEAFEKNRIAELIGKGTNATIAKNIAARETRDFVKKIA